jgi:SSS family solute:Na+ symporter
MKIEFLAAVLAYFGLLLAAGLLVPKRFRDLDAFFLASRRLGAPRVAFSLCAAWVGAASLLVSTDQAFLEGVSAFWMIGLPAVVTLLLFLPLARALRNLGGSTISDAMEARYGPAARPATTFLIVWYMTVLAASQMVAAGSFLKTFLGTSYLAGLAVSAAVVLLYLGAGGFLSVVRTQTVQFFLLAAGIVVLAASLWFRSSWADVTAVAGRQGRADYFDFLAHADRNFLIALSFVLAWTISPIAWQRIQAARSESSARRGVAMAALFLGFFYSGIVLAGMLFLPLFPETKPSNPLVAEYIGLKVGAVLGGLVFVTVLAAILSTMSAAINSGAFSLTGDLLRYRKQAGRDRGSVALGRAATLFVGGAAFLVATRFKDILTTLGLASQIMAEGLFVPGLAAILMRKRAPLAGLLSLFGGGGYALVCFLAEAGLFSLPVPPWPRSLPLGLATSAAGFVLGLLAGSNRRNKSSANRRESGRPTRRPQA